MLEKIPYYIPLVEFLKRLSIKARTQLTWSSITCSATENQLQHQHFLEIKINCLYSFCIFASFPKQCAK